MFLNPMLNLERQSTIWLDYIENKDWSSLSECFANENNIEVVCRSGKAHKTIEAMVTSGEPSTWKHVEKMVWFLGNEGKIITLRNCAFHGNVEFLKKFWECQWHTFDVPWVSHEIITKAAEGCQIDVLHWLDSPEVGFRWEDTEEMQFTLDLGSEWGVTNDDVPIFKYFWDKQLANGPGNLMGWKYTKCSQCIKEWAPKILEEFLFPILGRDYVLNAIFAEVEDNDDDEFEHEHAREIYKFLKKHRNGKHDIKCAMQLLDEIRDRIPEGHYVQISNHLMNVYNAEM